MVSQLEYLFFDTVLLFKVIYYFLSQNVKFKKTINQLLNPILMIFRL